MYLGKMSYSIYLWQQLFLNPTSTRLTMSLPAKISCILTIAAISYFGLERPLIALRTRMRTTPNPVRAERVVTAIPVLHGLENE